MGRTRWVLVATIVALSGCLAPDGAPNADAGDAGVACGPAGARCPGLAGFTITCEEGTCVARAPGGDARGDCLREGRYGADLRYDARNCGACGRVCPGSSLCVDGGCTDRCDAPSRRCGEQCVDPRTNTAHCGGCGRRCADDERCADGTCAPCPASATPCGASCVDLTSDPAHCGGCGRRCAAREGCTGGVCLSCQLPRAVCGETCVDLATDRAHCGACGRACAASERCEGGRCAACAAGLSRCDNACVDLSASGEHCGACGNRCPAGASCGGGRCVACRPGQMWCGGACIDVDRDENNCGACGRRCDGRCIFGECEACPPGSTACDGECYTAFLTAQNCGACGRACVGDCVDGRCVPCAPGLTFCGDYCVDVGRSAWHCGACRNMCSGGTACVSGACVTCTGGLRACGDGCVDLLTSATNCGSCGTACGAGQVCERGRCEAPCSDRVFTGHPDAHCGACGVACAAGTICIESRCVAVAPRPKAPISGTQVTSARPWFRWELPAGGDGARVEVCATRDCARVEARWDAVGGSSRAPAALAPGVHFWRLYARRGADRFDATPGLTWEFVVPAAIALPPSGGPAPAGVEVFDDFNGDGLPDAVDATCAGARDCVSVRFATPSGGPALPERRIPRPATYASGEWTTFYDVQGGGGYGDLNGDGYDDLLFYLGWTTLQRVAVRSTGNILQLFTGGPSGLAPRFHVFASRSDFDYTPGGQTAVPVGDRNGDGYGDVAVWYHSPSTPGFSVVFGGRPPAGGSDDVSGIVPSIAWLLVGDFNADGYGDLVTTTSATRSGYASVSFGAATPGARGASVAGCGAPSDAVALPFRGFVADVDLDGYDDLHAEWGSGVVTERVLFRGGPDGLSSVRCARLP